MPRKKMSGGNIKAESAYDPFPRSGLVKQFEPFIRKEVGKFCKRYPKLRRDDVLFEAIRLALTAEKKFNPKLGYDFSTPLRHHLKGLHRFAEREARLHRVNVALVDDGFQKAQEAKEAKEAKTPDGKFYPGPNGPRFTQDFEWMEKGKRKRAVVRVRLAGGSPIDRASPDVRTIARMNTD